MAAARLLVEKYVSALPATLTRNTMYFVRNGAGFDIYCTNDSGTVVAYALNVAAAGTNTQLQYNNNGVLAGASQLSVHDGHLFLNDDATPPVAVANKMGVFCNDWNGIQILSQLTADGRIQRFNSFIGFNSYDFVTAVPGAGVQALYAANTAISASSQIEPMGPTRLGQIPRITYRSGTTANSAAGLYYTRATLTRGSETKSGGFFVTIGFRQGDATYVANARTFAGLTTSIAAVSNVSPFTLVNSIGVAADPTRPNPNNLYFTINGTSANAFVVDTGLSIQTANEFLILEIYCAPNSTLIQISLRMVISGLKASTVFDAGTIPATQFLANNLMLAPRVYRQTIASTAVRLGFGFIYTERLNSMEVSA
jgi:hypothetical protein